MLRAIVGVAASFHIACESLSGILERHHLKSGHLIGLTMRILVTGSAGLIGRVLVEQLTTAGMSTIGYDTARPPEHPEHGDILDADRLRSVCRTVDGVVHLAAVARVKHAEADPEACHRVNVLGTRHVVDAIMASGARAWLVHASSREVYGDPQRLPVTENDPIAPRNVYGRSKAAAEGIVAEARARGLRAAVLRFANVYGSTHDHPDRVVPAFCRAAASGGTIRVEGVGYTFDFTHVEDVAHGVLAAIDRLAAGRRDLPPVHLASGRATRLEALAELAYEAGGRIAPIEHRANFAYNVACFVGDPSRAADTLGWRVKIPVEEGVQRLVAAFREASQVLQKN